MATIFLNEKTPFAETVNAIYYKSVNDLGQEIILQATKSDSPSLDELLAIKNDFEITNKTNIDGILKSYELVKQENSISIIKENFDGIPLVKYLKENILKVDQFLSFAIQLTKIVEQLHEKHVIHKDINPDNIFISKDGKTIKISHFGIATLLANEQQDVMRNNTVKGLISHISPEQTGRMNRSIDYRSDLYSLGITFYQALCRKLPFEYEELIELIHAHIARYPQAPHALDSSIPKVLSEIIMKLMAKNAEDRYQSATGLIADLEQCFKQFQKSGNIEAFPLAKHDFSSIFSASEKLYGRIEEVNALVKGFEISIHNSANLILVAGHSGIGKTRLINEIDKPVASKNGYFIKGKFEQFNRDIPYKAVSQAFSELVKKFLSDSPAKIANWKKSISHALKNEGQVLVELIPEMELLIGKQDDILKIGLTDSKQRFEDLFQNFLLAIADSGLPLVIFLDDLQWADSGSLDLIKNILSNNKLNNVILIGAYRNNEVNPSHPLMLTLDQIKKDVPHKLKTIVLNELSNADVNQFISDSLRCSEERSQELTDLTMKKTRGNPFFIKQFIYRLVNDQLIYFDHKKSLWDWNMAEISQLNVTDNVVDLVVSKIQKLPEISIQILQLAACIGNIFDIKTLSIISELPEHRLGVILWELVEEGFISPRHKWSKHAKDEIWKEFELDHDNSGYDFFCFQHDRIQQSAYSLIKTENKKTTHFKIGKLMLNEINLKDNKENLFETLKHLNFGLDLIKKQEEKDLIAQLNLEAGEKAKQSNAYQPALNFFNAGMQLVKHGQDFELSKNLLLACSETEYLCGNYKKSEKLFDQALNDTDSPIEKALILADKMSLYENTNRQIEAIKIALEGLKYVGVKLKENPGTVGVLTELMRAKFYLRNHTVESLKTHKTVESQELKVAMKILVNLWGPAYLYNQNLLVLAILRTVILSVKHGNSPTSALAYAFYGFVISAQLKDYKNGLEFAKLGVWLNEKLENIEIQSKVFVIYAGCVAYWTNNYSSLLDTLTRAHKVGIEANDLIYASYAFCFYGVDTLLMGNNLVECRNNLDKFLHFSRQINYPLTTHYILTLGRLLYNLTDTDPNEAIFQESSDPDLHFKDMKMIAKRDGTDFFIISHHIFKGMESYHMTHYDQAVQHFGSIEKIVVGVQGTPNMIVYNFYFSLSLLAKGIHDGFIKAKHKRFIRSIIKDFKKVSAINPINFKPLYLLLKAELAWHKKDLVGAQKLYNETNLAAKDSNFNHILAISNERVGRFYLEQSLNDVAVHHLIESYIDNDRWGAEAKKAQLIEEFVEINFDKEAFHKDAAHSIGTSSDSLDLQSIFKASTTISGEIVFERFVEKLLKIIIQNAGAQKVFLILNNEGKLTGEAYSDFERENVKILNSIPLEQIENIALSIVQYVYFTGDTLILKEAINDSRFSKDEYIIQHQPKSVLCFPFKQHGRTIALLYLENNIASGAFTPERVELLNLLSGQIAVSLENSLLYENLEQKVIDRTATIEDQKKEIESEKEKSDSLLLNILPFEIAEELKNEGSFKPRRHDNVTIMFTDFQDFTKLSEKISTEELVKMIDYYYSGFDKITTKYNVEKIKTIGDSYMCVSGLPSANPEHAKNAVSAALEMMQFTIESNAERAKNNQLYCQLRIGVHSGPVAAGVVGSKKFAYDIWGDSVNVASRLEGAAEAGKINISSSTYELIKDDFMCTYRGMVVAKSKGKIKMYFVDSKN